MLGALTVCLAGCGSPWRQAEPDRFPESHHPARQAQIGPATCLACHAEVHADWAESHHAMANRLADLRQDRGAFQTKRELRVGDASFTFSLAHGGLWIDYRETGTVVQGRPVGVLAYKPLRQYLMPFADGKFQVTSAAYDPARDEWFYVFGQDVRHPGDWGHWTGQGMNWNANCAYCHMTEFAKNLTPETGAYASTWLAQGIQCAQCHTGLSEHVASARKGGAVTPPTLSPREITALCASCHSRREELTPNRFRPGDLYDDHFRVALPDTPGTYRPDGQVADEDFVYGSMLLNRMGHAGIACSDCHTPHLAGLILPVDNNALCLSCHTTGNRGATVIEPRAHTHHPPGSTGALCVSCHMPVNPFMVRDPRRDHIFNSPDPVLTRELGLPNTCTSCHQDQPVEWAEKWVREWYGDDWFQSRRERTRLVASLMEGRQTDPAPFLALAGTEELAGWRAALTGMAAPWADRPEVRDFLSRALGDPDPLVRSAAVRALSTQPTAGPLLQPLLADPVRLVRLDAASALPPQTLPAKNRAELNAYLEMNSDRPTGALRLAMQGLQLGDRAAVTRWVRHAIGLERGSPAIAQDGSVLLAQAGDDAAALQVLQQAVLRHPDEASLHFNLGLLQAGREHFEESRQALERCVALDPTFHRGWFNLALVRERLGDLPQALAAIDEALQRDPSQSAYLQTKASFLVQLGRRDEARVLIERLRQMPSAPAPEP